MYRIHTQLPSSVNDPTYLRYCSEIAGFFLCDYFQISFFLENVSCTLHQMCLRRKLLLRLSILLLSYLDASQLVLKSPGAETQHTESHFSHFFHVHNTDFDNAELPSTTAIYKAAMQPDVLSQSNFIHFILLPKTVHTIFSSSCVCFIKHFTRHHKYEWLPKTFTIGAISL